MFTISSLVKKRTKPQKKEPRKIAELALEISAPIAIRYGLLICKSLSLSLSLPIKRRQSQPNNDAVLSISFPIVLSKTKKSFRNPKLINVCFNFCLFELIVAPINLRKTTNAIYNVCFVNDFGVFRVLEVSGRVNKSRTFDLCEKFELGFGRCLILGEN